MWIGDVIARIGETELASYAQDGPQALLNDIDALMRNSLLPKLGPDYTIEARADGQGIVAIHRTALVTPNTVIRDCAIIGPGCMLAGSAYLRGGVLLEEAVRVGEGVELRTCALFRGVRLMQANIVERAVVGENVRFEPGAMAGASFAQAETSTRNKAQERLVQQRALAGIVIGDDAVIGANAAVLPGAVIARGARIAAMSRVETPVD